MGTGGTRWAFVPGPIGVLGRTGAGLSCGRVRSLGQVGRRELLSRVVRACAVSPATKTTQEEGSATAAGSSVLDTDGEMATRYDPTEVEQVLYEFWESTGLFKPRASDDPNAKPFVIAMPPPNVTGGLHMGHAMFTTLEDILTRYHRMKGVPTLWLPGTDHAGIATQLQVEKALIAEGTDRQSVGREEFLRRVWQWKAEKGGYITKQLRRLGASCDWSRERFTLDEGLSQSVLDTFKTLHDRGLIYRGEYMVNWSPNLQTAVSDLEVEFSEEEGKLYHFKYGIADSEDLVADGSLDYLPVATTRPETILGDTAVCVHPEDERYKHLVGRKCIVPMSGGRTIPIIADDYVDMEFGTGALKITPGHDVNDYEIGKRHGLENMCIMNRDATMNDLCGSYSGMDRFECRKSLWADLESADIALKAEKYTTRVPRSQRGGEVIEPLVSKQWFLKMESLAKPALEAVKSGELKIIPDRFERTYEQWLENIHDWCISRQLWWGHQIPVWYVDGTDEKVFIVSRSEEEAYEEARSEHGPDVKLTRELDVLDTWFSSALWPFSTLGWPKSASDLDRFYPNSVMETGYDILFFWVARMVMMGIELTGKVPFHTIYLHGLVRDSQGRKMSKTLGNVIDPLEVIASYGTDALRYSLVTGSTPGQDISLSMDRIEVNRNFANKLWNAGRFIMGNLSQVSAAESDELKGVIRSDFRDDLSALALPERYIISRLHQLIHSVENSLDTYNFGESGRLVHDFLWDEFADWYIEISKTRMTGTDESAKLAARKTLVYVLDSCLRLLHPFMPFVTEALWQRLPHDKSKEEALITAAWPTAGQIDEDAIERFNQIQALTKLIRNARAEYQVEPQKKIEVVVSSTDDIMVKDLAQEKGILELLVKADGEKFMVGNRDNMEVPESDSAVSLIVSDSLQAFLPMSGLIDYEKEIARLEKQLAKAEKDLAGLNGRLNSASFTAKAPEKVVIETKEQASFLQDKVDTLKSKISDVQKQSMITNEA